MRIPSWMKWSKLKNEVQTGEVVKDGPKSMSSDESSNQRIYGNIMEDVNENRRFIQLKVNPTLSNPLIHQFFWLFVLTLSRILFTSRMIGVQEHGSF